MKKLLVASVFVLLAPTVFARSVKPTSFAGTYRPMEDASSIPTMKSCAQARIEVIDGRKEQKVGERVHEDQRSVRQPITMEGGVANWAKDAVDEVTKRAVLGVDPGSKRLVRVRLAEVWIDEVVYRRAEYDGRVVIDVDVLEGEKSCWSGRFTGFAENYGYAGSEENYQETINHAMDKALIAMLSDARFGEVVCECGE